MTKEPKFHIVRVGKIKRNVFPVATPEEVVTKENFRAHVAFLNKGRDVCADTFVARDENDEPIGL